VAAMIVLVSLEDGVSPGAYGRWVLESYAPAVRDPEQLGRDMESEEMQRLLSELHELAEVTQIMAERFA
jgi:hypothetical protein